MENPFEQIYQRLKKIEDHLAILSSETPSRNIMRIDDVVELLGVSKSTIYSKTCSGEIPHYKAAGKLYFDEKELLDWVKKT